MKKIAHFLVFVLTIATLLLSACGGSATPNAGGGKVEAIPVAFTGVVESMAGDQWVINGQTVTVDPAVVRDGPFNIGDHVKVEGIVSPDGSFTVSRVETPSAQDLSTLPQFGDDNSNTNNSNDANVNDANSNGANSNDANSNDANVNEDNSNTSGNENAANVNDDNGNTANSNDDNGAAGNSNDANSNDDNSNTSGNDNGGGGNDNGGGGNDSGGGGNDNGGNGNGG